MQQIKPMLLEPTPAEERTSSNIARHPAASSFWGRIGIRPQYFLLLAPLLFAAHIAEEAPGLFSVGYISWFNSFMTPKLAESGFVRGNIEPLLITTVLAALVARIGRLGMAYILLAWLSHFMLANGLFHVIATLVQMRYSPGVVTATFLYLPFFAWFVSYLRTELRASSETIFLIALLSGLPMFLQTYLVVFKHSQFF
jgi:hypothetical protein